MTATEIKKLALHYVKGAKSLADIEKLAKQSYKWFIKQHGVDDDFECFLSLIQLYFSSDYDFKLAMLDAELASKHRQMIANKGTNE